ncbi:hypothetical protein [Asticcacaulis solisilvae]|uniref:hypothetical protein n=1 Tax=Asticcacaulis solisilvae TaxID=1217274 RepID=UPI003FD76441
MFTWPKSATYTTTALLMWAGFLACIYALEGARSHGWSQPAIIALSLVPALIVIVQFLLAYRLIARQDEFTRALTAKRILAASGLAIALVVAASVTQAYAGLPAFPLWLVYPVFWGLFGMVTPVIRDSRP